MNLVVYRSIAALHSPGTYNPPNDNDNDLTIMMIQHTRYTMALRAYTAYRPTETRERIFRKTTRRAEKMRLTNGCPFCPAPACTAQTDVIHTRLLSKFTSLSYLRPFRNTHKGNSI